MLLTVRRRKRLRRDSKADADADADVDRNANDVGDDAGAARSNDSDPVLCEQPMRTLDGVVTGSSAVTGHKRVVNAGDAESTGGAAVVLVSSTSPDQAAPTIAWRLNPLQPVAASGGSAHALDRVSDGRSSRGADDAAQSSSGHGRAVPASPQDEAAKAASALKFFRSTTSSSGNRR